MEFHHSPPPFANTDHSTTSCEAFSVMPEPEARPPFAKITEMDLDTLKTQLKTAKSLPEFHELSEDTLKKFKAKCLEAVGRHVRHTRTWWGKANKNVMAHLIRTGFAGPDGEKKYDGAVDGEYHNFRKRYAEQVDGIKDHNIGKVTHESEQDGSGSPDSNNSNNSMQNDSVGEAILGLVEDRIDASVQEAEVREIVQNEIEDVTDTVLEMIEEPPPEKILVDEANSLDISMADKHAKFPVLYRLAQCRVPVYMEGRPGTGKNTLHRQLGDALGLDARSIPCSPDKRDYHFTGYRNADGELQFDTPFREIWENGGILLLDEVCQAHPSVLTVINDAVANGVMEFADGRVEKSDDLIIMLADNTGGLGGTEMYPDRNRLDAAFLDRYVYVEVKEDWEMVSQALNCSNGYRTDSIDFVDKQEVTRGEWVQYVKQVSDLIKEQQKPIQVGPRSAFLGAKLLENGFPLDFVKSSCVYKAHDETLVREIESSINSKI